MIIEKISHEIKELVDEGRSILYYEALLTSKFDEKQEKEALKISKVVKLKDRRANTKSEYQVWYQKGIRVVRQLSPERLSEFTEYYKSAKPPKEINYSTYTISDYLNGLIVTRGVYKEKVVEPFSAFSSKFGIQIDMINAIYENSNSLLLNIEGVLQSSFFDAELLVAEEFLKKNHLRSSGAICGVVLEKHFKTVCENHQIKFKKKNITISDYNEEMKNTNLIDTPTWRLIQRLGDIRNLSVHSKDREPTKHEIEDLIRGCKKIIAELN